MAAAASAAASSDKPQLASAADAAKWAAKLRKVHLHLHIDGSVRVGTLFEYGRKRGRLPAGVQTEAQLAPLVQVPSDCQSLVQYLTAFGNLLPLVRGDLEAVERIGFELCQDQHRDGVVYFEGRFAPHLFAEGQVTAEDVLQAMLAGFSRGRRQFGVNNRVLLCCLRNKPEWSLEVVRLANKYRDSGVAGIDLAGDESFSASLHRDAFDEALRLGIHRTVHAGEAGPAENVDEALSVLHAERIGHGYHVLENQAVYDRVRREGVHLECCLLSSLQTRAVVLARDALEKHPIATFAKDGVSFGLSTDNSSVSSTTLTAEYALARSSARLSEAQLQAANRAAALASFLPAADKERLLAEL